MKDIRRKTSFSLRSMAETAKFETETEGGENQSELQPEEPCFEELGLEPRLIQALKLGNSAIKKPTPIQIASIPFILEGKDLFVQANTGSGKTMSYVLALVQKLLNSRPQNKIAPSAIVLVPSIELCHRVYKTLSSILDFCSASVNVTQLKSSKHTSDLVLSCTNSDILVSTPACILKCVSTGALRSLSIAKSLEIIVLDEADLLMAFGYEEEIKALVGYLPAQRQSILVSATSSDDVENLKKLILRDACILTLPDKEPVKDDFLSGGFEHFYVSCNACDKLLYVLAILKLDLVQKKILIFTSNGDTSFKLKLLLEKFGIKARVLNTELPINSQLRIIEEFNAGIFDYMVATIDFDVQGKARKDDLDPKPNFCSKYHKNKLRSRFGYMKKISFKHIHTIMFFDLPKSAADYKNMIQCIKSSHNTIICISLVSPNELQFIEELNISLRREGSDDPNILAKFSLLTKNAVESIRYRVEDVARGVTKVAIKEAKAQDLRNEILKCEKLKTHFKDNPKDLDVLKHDKVLKKNYVLPYLNNLPDYLQDPVTEEMRKTVKFFNAASWCVKPSKCSRKRKRKNKDSPETNAEEQLHERSLKRRKMPKSKVCKARRK